MSREYFVDAVIREGLSKHFGVIICVINKLKTKAKPDRQNYKAKIYFVSSWYGCEAKLFKIEAAGTDQGKVSQKS